LICTRPDAPAAVDRVEAAAVGPVVGAIAAAEGEAEPASAMADFAAVPAVAERAGADRLVADGADSAAALPTAALEAAKIGRRFNRSLEPASREAIPAANRVPENQIQIPASPDLAIPAVVNLVLANPVRKNQGPENPAPVLLAGVDRNPGNPAPESLAPANRALINLDPENQMTTIGPVARIGLANPAMAIGPGIVPVIDRVIVLGTDRVIVPVTDPAIGLITVIDRVPASRRAIRTGRADRRRTGTDIGKMCITAGITERGTDIGIPAAPTGTPIPGVHMGSAPASVSRPG
jgi:hypothetical protein